MKLQGRLRSNILANMAGSAIAAMAAAACAPLIYRTLGPDAYGLIGIYVLLQSLMPLFDLGLTAGLGRAVAWHRGRGNLGKVRTLIRLASRPILVLVTLLSLASWAGADVVVHQWLGDSKLPAGTLRGAVWMMVVALSFRLLASLHRASLMALEFQVEANLVQGAAVVVRTFGSLAFALATGTGILGFFATQAPISLVEYWVYRKRLASMLQTPAYPVSREELRDHLRFALGIAGLSAVWLLTSQVDKAVLARVLPLPAYGAYSLGVHIASVILLAVGTIHGAFLPRMTRHFSAGEPMDARTLYGLATTLTIALSAAFVVAIIIGGQLVVPSLQISVDGVVPTTVALWYGIGNAGVAMLALGYQLQNARGSLRVHAWGTSLQAFLQVPIVALVASRGDTRLTAISFAAVNWLFVLAWMPAVHAKFLPDGHSVWFVRQFFPPFVCAVLAGGVVVLVAQMAPGGVFAGTLATGAGAAFVLTATSAIDPQIRRLVCDWRRAHA